MGHSGLDGEVLVGGRNPGILSKVDSDYFSFHKEVDGIRCGAAEHLIVKVAHLTSRMPVPRVVVLLDQRLSTVSVPKYLSLCGQDKSKERPSALH